MMLNQMLNQHLDHIYVKAYVDISREEVGTVRDSATVLARLLSLRLTL